jgi:RimJ/RimL family protein N-acetyltransferase
MRLRPARESDLTFLLEQEARPEFSPFINAWPLERHRAALANPDYRYQIFEGGRGATQGYAITRGYAAGNRAVELVRMVLAQTGSGRGRAACLLLLAQAFNEDNTHRFWLDLFEDNARAEHLYRSLGFTFEGILRDAERRGEIFRSLKVMSILDHEYRQRHGAT